jgi:GntR family transcriptional repressor for pyruvate dehydrogenase complex
MTFGEGFEPDVVDTRSAAEQIAAQLHQALVAGALKPGDRLPSEAQLAEGFAVSRSTLREAVKLLRGQGLLETQRGAKGGHFVAKPRADDLAAELGRTFCIWFDIGEITVAEVDEARHIVELACVRLAAERATEDDLDEMRGILEAQADRDISLTEFLELDVAFHQAISVAARNHLLSLPMSAIHIVRPRTNTLIQHHDRERVVAQHQALLEAVGAGDADAAEAAIIAHMSFLNAQRQEEVEAPLAELPELEENSAEADPATS